MVLFSELLIPKESENQALQGWLYPGVCVGGVWGGGGECCMKTYFRVLAKEVKVDKCICTLLQEKLVVHFHLAVTL